MGQPRGCGTKFKTYVEKGFNYVEREVRCGGTNQYGGQHLCEKCEQLPDPNYCGTCHQFVGGPHGADYICHCG